MKKSKINLTRLSGDRIGSLQSYELQQLQAGLEGCSETIPLPLYHELHQEAFLRGYQDSFLY